MAWNHSSPLNEQSGARTCTLEQCSRGPGGPQVGPQREEQALRVGWCARRRLWVGRRPWEGWAAGGEASARGPTCWLSLVSPCCRGKSPTAPGPPAADGARTPWVPAPGPRVGPARVTSPDGGRGAGGGDKEAHLGVASDHRRHCHPPTSLMGRAGDRSRVARKATCYRLSGGQSHPSRVPEPHRCLRTSSDPGSWMCSACLWGEGGITTSGFPALAI